MSVKRLVDRVPSANPKSVAKLKGHDLRFHKISKDGSGKCDAYETNEPEHYVLGVVFEIAESEKQNLDRKEGLGYGYDQKEVTLTLMSGEIIKAITYYATKIGADLKPYHWYKHHVLIGAKENALPEEYIEKINNIESIADPKPERQESEMTIYANK